jgi:hypothetical protein
VSDSSARQHYIYNMCCYFYNIHNEHRQVPGTSSAHSKYTPGVSAYARSHVPRTQFESSTLHARTRCRNLTRLLGSFKGLSKGRLVLLDFSARGPSGDGRLAKSKLVFTSLPARRRQIYRRYDLLEALQAIGQALYLDCIAPPPQEKRRLVSCTALR